jgi:hypothetical protein
VELRGEGAAEAAIDEYLLSPACGYRGKVLIGETAWERKVFLYFK